MNTANLNTLIQRYEDNFEWINNAEHDEIFKWRAVRCFQDVWFSEEVEDISVVNCASSNCVPAFSAFQQAG